MILDEIIAHKRHEVAERRRATPVDALRTQPLYAEPRRGFRTALASAPAPAVIAELKSASPSCGTIRADYDPPALAQSYACGGATALSVLTDTRYFAGALEHLVAARAAVSLPCLRKDFMIDSYQVEEARAHGADCVLVIAAAGTSAERGAVMQAARAARLDVLVEVHNESELDWAIDSGADLIGVNNRDLATFQVTLATTERLARRVPAGVLLVAESGMRGPADVRRMIAAGAHAVLVGEAFMSAPDPGAALAEWLGCRSK